MHDDVPSRPTALEESRAALIAALRGVGRDRPFEGPIRSAARRYGQAARAAGIPPERLVILLKQLFASSEIGGIGDWFRRVLTDRAIVWAIDGYYELESD